MMLVREAGPHFDDVKTRSGNELKREIERLSVRHCLMRHSTPRRVAHPLGWDRLRPLRYDYRPRTVRMICTTSGRSGASGASLRNGSK